jgi:hypothetical protein
VNTEKDLWERLEEKRGNEKGKEKRDVSSVGAE